MIRTLLALLPAGSGPRLAGHLALTTLGVLLRAAGVVLLVPLVSALFSDDPAGAWPWVAWLTLATAAGWAVDSVTVRLGFDIGFGLLESGQRAVADRLAEIRLTWFTSGHTATARQAVAATGPDLVGLIIHLVAPIVGAVLLPIAIGLALLPIAWPLGAAALAGVPVLLGAFWLAGRVSRSADRAAAASNSALTERIVEFARTQQALRASRRVGVEGSHVGAALAAQHGASMRLLLLQVPGQLIFGLASQVALVLLAGTIVVLTTSGALAAPAAVALIVVVVRYLEPFTVLAELSPGVESALGVLRDIREVLDAPAVPAGRVTQVGGGGGSAADVGAPDRASDGVRDLALGPRLELRDVQFSYGAASPRVLDGLSLTFEPGTTTAIVGPSGSGKSTVLSLLAGLQHPTAGAVFVDGVDAATLTGAARRELVSVVFQHPYLFDGSIRDNVLVGRPAADDAQLELAAQLAQVDELIARLPDGWDSRAGEAGGSLSGGEKQRVSIARALLKPAPVLLVDEATSALDTENEAAVASALAGDPAPRTRVIVAHRLSSIRAADRVVFLESGVVVEDGTIDELLAAGGRFAEFWRQQDAAGAWQLRSSEAG
ncbi:ATP-binding cassette subfamily B protein IrtB [Leucobacter komagatae]|uniref:ATP-binding cassette subfamily B protein IrtB n=1 Tax=Leucobacter komagatae TaxID=55969 RepID=A0A542Y228_9MICO|nr:ABC transporter ATP-binding protein [Leucobacter komagatae]TQL42124.1 ATP-binding cassette subfamily B protein IrtB [Leucobacter komagatae]